MCVCVCVCVRGSGRRHASRRPEYLKPHLRWCNLQPQERRRREEAAAAERRLREAEEARRRLQEEELEATRRRAAEAAAATRELELLRAQTLPAAGRGDDAPAFARRCARVRGEEAEEE